MTAPMSDVFAALSDPTRFAIVERLLSEGDMTVGRLSAPFEISAPAISRHVKLLEDVGLIERRIEKQWRVCRLRRECFAGIEEWLGRYRAFWDQSFDRLEEYLNEDQKGS